MAESNETIKSETNNVQKESCEELKHLEEATNLIEKVTGLATNVKQACQTISTGTGDGKCTTENKDYLTIGKECVQPLTELKNTATEVFSNVKHTEVKMLNQAINVESIEKRIDELNNWSEESRMIISMFKLLVDTTEKFIEQQSSSRDNANVDESCVSVASSDPSISEFSLFDSNTSTSAATSSPISNNEDLNKQRE